MRILDRYVLGQYLKNFFTIEMAFFVLFIVIDIFDRGPRLSRYGATTGLMARYFVARVPYLFVLTSPVVMLLAGLFLFSNLSKYNETIAIRAAGISILRTIRPVLLFGLFWSLVMVVTSDRIVPLAKDYEEYIYHTKIKGRKKEDVRMRPRISYKGPAGSLYHIGFFDGYRNLMKDVNITIYDPKTGKLIRRVNAPEANWQDSVWVFTDCLETDFNNGVPVYSKFSKSIPMPEMDTSPIDFIKSAKNPLQMNWFELREYISRLQKIGEKHNKELVQLQQKISFPFANFIILLFCVPLATTSVRSKSRGLIFFGGLVIAFVFMTVMRLTQSMGYGGYMQPFWAAWLPNLIFFTIGVGLVIKSEV